jgi:hypothetical protein
MELGEPLLVSPLVQLYNRTRENLSEVWDQTAGMRWEWGLGHFEICWIVVVFSLQSVGFYFYYDFSTLGANIQNFVTALLAAIPIFTYILNCHAKAKAKRRSAMPAHYLREMYN